MPSTSSVRRLLATPLLALLGASCDLITPPDPDDEKPPARIWAINGAGDAIRVRVDGEALGGAVPAGNFSSRIVLGDGAGSVRIEPALGSSLTGGVTIPLPADGSGSGQGRTFVLVSEASGAIQAQLMNDSQHVATPDQGKLRMVHAASGSPAIDIWYRPSGATAFTRFATPMNYGATSDYVVGAPGLWQVIVTPRMTPAPGEDPTTQILEQEPIFVGAGTVYTFVVFTGAGGPQLAMRPVQ